MTYGTDFNPDNKVCLAQYRCHFDVPSILAGLSEALRFYASKLTEAGGNAMKAMFVATVLTVFFCNQAPAQDVVVAPQQLDTPTTPVDTPPNAQAEIARITTPTAATDAVLQIAFPVLANKSVTCGADTAKEKKLAILNDLANHEVEFNYIRINDETSVSFMQELLSGKGQDLVIQKDHRSYKFYSAGSDLKKLGFLIRIEARLTTLTANVDISSLFAMGMAAKLGQTKGNLSVRVFGLTGKPIYDLLPSPSDLSEGSIQSAIEAVALIRSKIYDEGVIVMPQELKDLPSAKKASEEKGTEPKKSKRSWCCRT
ncbi:hypothetical protein [Pseudomonas sp. CGJS7]|uniref:hypothetical protein n=1 Tax=Pseudomonas sp. CGJS7 TaxID=3109348 RepID=UPI003008DF4E